MGKENIEAFMDTMNLDQKWGQSEQSRSEHPSQVAVRIAHKY